MKTTIWFLVLTIIGTLTFTPIIPKHYPPKKVVEQRQFNNALEIKLDGMVKRLEYEVKVDSVQLEIIKK